MTYNDFPDEAYHAWVDQEFTNECTEAAKQVVEILDDYFPGRADDLSELADLIGEAHTADDPDWAFNVTRLIDNILENTGLGAAADSLPLEAWTQLESSLDFLFPCTRRHG